MTDNDPGQTPPPVVPPQATAPVDQTPPPDPATAIVAAPAARKRPAWLIPVIVVAAVVVVGGVAGGIIAAVSIAKGVAGVVANAQETFVPGAPDAITQVADGYQVTSDSYDYSVVFPGEPTQADPGKLPALVQNLSVYEWTDNASVVLIDEAGYITVASGDTRTELESAVKGMSATGGATGDVTYSTFHGLDSAQGTASLNGISGKFVAAVQGHRVYTLLYLGDDTIGQKFLDSFTPTH